MRFTPMTLAAPPLTLALLSASPVQAQTSHSYCYGTLYEMGVRKKLWVSKPHEAQGGNDARWEAHLKDVFKFGPSFTVPQCNDYNSAAAAANARRDTIDRFKAAGAEIVEVAWP